MSKHYTKNTISASKWCNKCHTFTQHRVDQGRLSYCLVCIASDEARRKNVKAGSEPKQESLFQESQ